MSDLISFALVQLKTGVTPQIAPNALGAGDVGGTTAIANRAFVAIAGDGDKILESGETAYVLSGVRSSNGVSDTGMLNGADDPVQIKVHGRIDTSTVGALSTDTALGFNSTWGFGVDNGPDGNTRNLNGGDSITWTLNERAGVPQRLQAVSFTVDRGTSTAATLIAIDFDGDVVRSGAYQTAQTAANAHKALEFSAVHNELVAIDFDARTLTVNGVVRTGAEIEAFFAAYDVSPKNVLTIGGIGTAGFSVRDLVLQRTDYAGPPENQAPTVALTPVVSTLAENTPTTTSIKLADIIVSDDGVGRNDLSLAGANAASFEIRDGAGGKELHLKAGAVLDYETKPTLDVQIVVDDTSVGASPDATTTFNLGVTDVKEAGISFAVVQLKAGVTPQTAPNALGAGDVGGTTAIQNRAFVAIAGDGDKILESGETAYVLSGVRSSNGVSDTGTLNGADDPVQIKVHGRINTSTVGALSTDTALGFNSTWGFGVDNGPDGNTRNLNGGDSITWTLNERAGVPQRLQAVSFTVDRGTSTAATLIAIDFDGDVVRSGAYPATQTAANAHKALEFSAVHNELVAIDFDARTLTVNGVVRTGAEIEAFFTAYDVSPKNVLTIGGIGTAGFSVRDLVLQRTDYAGSPENQAPTVALTPVVSTLAENANTTTSIKVADIVVSDPDGVGTNTLSLAGSHADLFAIVDNAGGKELHLKAGTALDFETLASLSVSVAVDDASLGTGAEASAPFTLTVTDVKDTYGTISLDGAVGEWPSTARLDTPSSGTEGYALYGSYQDEAFVLALQAPVAIGPNTTLWFNTDLNTTTGFQIFGWAGGAEYNINFGPDGRPALYTGADGQTLVSDALPFRLSADGTVIEIALPSALVGGARSANVLVDVNNSVFLPNNYALGGYRIGENSPPSITLTPVVSTLAENANTTTSIKVADIVVSDPDGVGTNMLSLAGSHADLFAIVDGVGGKELHLKAGTALDFETLASLSVSVAVDDPSLGTGAEASAPFTLTVTDVKETYGAITLDGVVGEWPSTARLDTPSSGTEGYALYGSYQDEAFVLALQAPVAIGPNTTLWFNTDLNTTTGFQIFGWAGGAEYNINFGADGRPALYTGADGQTLVSDALPFRLSADGTVIEIALPSALVGGARSANVLVDVNNSVFLPGNYALGGYRVEEKAPLLPQDPSLKVAIVYSDTSANNFYYKTAYGQLFMAAQNQAYQAGIPFDVISEDALTDIANLVGYDAIVFPGFSHVKAANLAAITTALTSASKDYGIGLIAAGNFMTNDETGAAIAGDSYIRMKQLLGVTLQSFGTTSGIVLKAAGVTHPVSDLYAPSEVVGQYTNTSYLYFSDVSGNGQTLFSQQVTGGDVSAVIANTNGGRNVHFASDAIMGNNNILAEALNWSARDDAPDVGLQMTRGTSLFFSRNDMDQSQELYDVVDTNPGIYDAMIPIVEQWYKDYGFVGSYYINIGNNPGESQETNWAISGPYYQQLLALESEIGTHSYTHPEDTNLLSAAEIQFQFQQSRQIIEQQLGISMAGAAVPGAPENLQTSLEIIQYFNYLTGGYSATGAGYPGAFGFLTPDNTNKVYFAPNVSFDFSLIGFRNLTPAQAEAVWTQEYNTIVAKGSTPIIHWPWHDYGPTQWDLGDGPSEYTLAMFTNFIQRAYADGTEFVTGADLAQRIQSFVASDITIRQEGGKIVATVTGTDVGKFALDVDTNQVIASVDNWYAFDGAKVFLPKEGGTFAITLGSQEADVTRIAELPMRAELLSANGNGTDLDFALNGRGDAKVDLKAWGADSVIATGADSGTLSGEVLKLSFANLGNHSVTIDYVASGPVTGTAGNDFIIGSDQGRTIDGGLGNDYLFGGGGEDAFVYRVGGGIDMVLDFTPTLDKIQLVGSGFATAQEALAQFFQDAGGLTLSLSDNDHLVLANTTQIGEEHILLA